RERVAKHLLEAKRRTNFVADEAGPDRRLPRRTGAHLPPTRAGNCTVWAQLSERVAAVIRLLRRYRHPHEIRRAHHGARVTARSLQKFAVGRHPLGSALEQAQRGELGRLRQVPPELFIQTGAIEAPERL